ncbi:O-succinylbenzoate-CoA synthase [Salmonella bongori]|nr:O-succinylbenzoate-CoA synthase [Salmonella bongori]
MVLRDRRLKTRDGLYVCLRDGEREGWGEISPLPGFSQETREEAQTTLLAWVSDWLQGNDTLPEMPSVAFGASCALAELTGVLPEAADYRVAPLCTGDPDDFGAAACRYARREKSLRSKWVSMKRYVTAWWLICCWR